MAFTSAYARPAPSRREVEALGGPAVLEFGASWCGFCIGAQPLIQSALGAHPEVRHIKIEDGPRRPLGRSYRITLWPTLVFLDNGREVERLVRPTDATAVTRALGRIAATNKAVP